MSAAADVVVIGGGLHGLSTALHLALRGIRAIVIEKDYAGRHASGVNAGGVRTLARHIAEVPLSLAAMEIWSNIRELVDDDCGLVSDGQVLIAEDEAEFAAMRGCVEELRLKGFTHEELIGREELRRLVPCVAGHCPGGVVSRRDGAADPFRTTQAFRRKAEALGQRVIEGVAVGDLSRRGSSWHLTTTRGAFEAPIIVNAAGAWADRIAASLSEPVPLEAVALMLMVTVPMAAWIKPVVILRGRKLSFKQLASGAVVIGGGHAGRVSGAVPGHAGNADSARLGRDRGAHARRSAGDLQKCSPSGSLSSVRLQRPRFPARSRRRRADGRADRHRPLEPGNCVLRHRAVFRQARNPPPLPSTAPQALG